jgi:hypothetical protein
MCAPFVPSTIRKQRSRRRVGWLRSSNVHRVSRRFLLSDPLQFLQLFVRLVLSAGLDCTNRLPCRQLLPIASVSSRMHRGSLECNGRHCLHVLSSRHLWCAQQSNLLCCRLLSLSAWILLRRWRRAVGVQCGPLRHPFRTGNRIRRVCRVLCWFLLYGRRADGLSFRSLERGDQSHRRERVHPLSSRPLLLRRQYKQFVVLPSRLHLSSVHST